MVSVSWVCWSCRKQTRRAQWGENRPARCPSCGKPMENVGKNFCTPRYSDVRGWKSTQAKFRRLKLGYLSRNDKATAWELKRKDMFKK